LQRDEDRAAAALLHQIEAMVEELAEEHEPQVERGGEAHVWRHVRQQVHLPIVRRAKHLIQARTGDDLSPRVGRRGGVCRRVAPASYWIEGRLVANQVGDDAWLRVKDGAAGLGI